MIPLGVLAGSRHAALGGGTYRDEVLADSPLIYLRLDESSGPPVDYGSLGVTPTAHTTWPTWGGMGLGDGDSSAHFPGSNGVGIGVGPISQIDSSGPATFEALIRLNTNSDQAILARSSTGGTSCRFQILRETRSIQYMGSPWPTNRISSPSYVISSETTHHVAVTATGTICTIYVDGSPVASGAAGFTDPAGDGNHQWIVGRSLAIPYELPSNGNFAGVAFYDTALTAARILAHAQAAGVA